MVRISSVVKFVLALFQWSSYVQRHFICASFVLGANECSRDCDFFLVCFQWSTYVQQHCMFTCCNQVLPARWRLYFVQRDPCSRDIFTDLLCRSQLWLPLYVPTQNAASTHLPPTQNIRLIYCNTCRRKIHTTVHVNNRINSINQLLLTIRFCGEIP